MQGIDSKLLQKLEIRVRQKVYEEMVEQYERFKQQKLQNKNILDPYSKTKGEKDQVKPRYGKASQNSTKLQQNPSGLNQTSVFLPALSSHKPVRNEVSNREPRQFRRQYLKYLKRREQAYKDLNKTCKYNCQQSQTNDHSMKKQTTEVESSMQQRKKEEIQQYLMQCEHIISKLKNIISKSKEKQAQAIVKQDKKDDQNKRLPSKSFRIQIKPKDLSKSFITKQYSFSGLPSKSTNLSTQNNELENKSVDVSLVQVKNSKSEKEFADWGQRHNQKLNTKARQNNHKISQIKAENIQAQESKPKKTPKTTTNKSQNTNTTKAENERAKDKKAAQNNSKAKTQQKKQQEGNVDDPQYQQKKQSATIKYLKKLRACGSQLYQKIQGHKKTGEGEAEANHQNQPINPS